MPLRPATHQAAEGDARLEAETQQLATEGLQLRSTAGEGDSPSGTLMCTAAGVPGATPSLPMRSRGGCGAPGHPLSPGPDHASVDECLQEGAGSSQAPERQEGRVASCPSQERVEGAVNSPFLRLGGSPEAQRELAFTPCLVFSWDSPKPLLSPQPLKPWDWDKESKPHSILWRSHPCAASDPAPPTIAFPVTTSLVDPAPPLDSTSTSTSPASPSPPQPARQRKRSRSAGMPRRFLKDMELPATPCPTGKRRRRKQARPESLHGTGDVPCAPPPPPPLPSSQTGQLTPGAPPRLALGEVLAPPPAAQRVGPAIALAKPPTRHSTGGLSGCLASRPPRQPLRRGRASSFAELSQFTAGQGARKATGQGVPLPPSTPMRALRAAGMPLSAPPLPGRERAMSCSALPTKASPLLPLSISDLRASMPTASPAPASAAGVAMGGALRGMLGQPLHLARRHVQTSPMAADVMSVSSDSGDEGASGGLGPAGRMVATPFTQEPGGVAPSPAGSLAAAPLPAGRHATEWDTDSDEGGAEVSPHVLSTSGPHPPAIVATPGLAPQAAPTAVVPPVLGEADSPRSAAAQQAGEAPPQSKGSGGSPLPELSAPTPSIGGGAPASWAGTPAGSPGSLPSPVREPEKEADAAKPRVLDLPGLQETLRRAESLLEPAMNLLGSAASRIDAATEGGSCGSSGSTSSTCGAGDADALAQEFVASATALSTWQAGASAVVQAVSQLAHAGILTGDHEADARRAQASGHALVVLRALLTAQQLARRVAELSTSRAEERDGPRVEPTPGRRRRRSRRRAS